MKIERVTQIYETIEKFQITLSSDPITLGPKYLQDGIANCRNFLNSVSNLLMEVHIEKQLLRRELNLLLATYNIDAAELLSSDDRVRRLPNIKDREATVKVILRDQLRIISSKTDEMADLDLVEKAIRHRHEELKNTMADIKMQRSLIQTEIDTGAMYGDERTGGSRMPGLTVPDMIDDDEVNRLLGISDKPEETPKMGNPHSEPEEDSSEHISTAELGVPEPAPAIQLAPESVSTVVYPPAQEVLGALQASLDPEGDVMAMLADVVMDDEVASFLSGKKGATASGEDSDFSFLNAV